MQEYKALHNMQIIQEHEISIANYDLMKHIIFNYSTKINKIKSHNLNNFVVVVPVRLSA